MPRNTQGNSSNTSSIHTPSMDPVRNPSSPFNIHLGENPLVVLVSPPLSGANYHSWTQLMKRAMVSKNKFLFVDGRISNAWPLWFQLWSLGALQQFGTYFSFYFPKLSLHGPSCWCLEGPQRTFQPRRFDKSCRTTVGNELLQARWSLIFLYWNESVMGRVRKL